MDLLGKIEVKAEEIAASRSTATQRIHNLIGFVEKIHYEQYMFDRNLHELIDAAITENWPIMRRHNERMAAIFEQIIASGIVSGEFPLGDATLAARLVNTAFLPAHAPQPIARGVAARHFIQPKKRTQPFIATQHAQVFQRPSAARKHQNPRQDMNRRAVSGGAARSGQFMID
jgi:Tetracyclin repressor-like, C-terminal domain